MHLPSLKTATVVALLAGTITVPSAKAVLSYNSDDLFLGFHQDGNTGNEFVINLGQASAFRDAPAPFTLSINLTQFNTAMTSAFGATWKTAGNIHWGVAGTTQNTAVGSDPIRLLYASEPVGLSAPASTNGQSTPANNIIAFKGFWIGGTEAAVTNSVIEDPTQPNAWTTWVGSGTPFNSSEIAPLEDLMGNNLNLFRIPQTSTAQAVTSEGAFSINLTTGAIQFTPPVPEPSSMALLGISLGSLVGLQRFRRRR